jgi:hypothetical protein
VGVSERAEIRGSYVAQLDNHHACDEHQIPGGYAQPEIADETFNQDDRKRRQQGSEPEPCAQHDARDQVRGDDCQYVCDALFEREMCHRNASNGAALRAIGLSPDGLLVRDRQGVADLPT